MSGHRTRLRLALVPILTLVGLATAAVPASGKERLTLRLGVFPNVTHAPGLVGIAGGTFEKALGDKVTLEPSAFDTGTTAVQALLSGAIDATYIGPSPAITGFAVSGGEALRIIAGSTSGGAFLVVKPGITKAADLKDKKLATPSLGNTQDVSLRAWLDSEGLATDTTGGGDVSILPQKSSTTLDAFRQGLIDGAWVPEPWATRLIEEGGGTVLVDESDLWPNGQFVTTHLIVNTTFLREHKAVVRRLLEGHLAALALIETEPRAAQRLVAFAIKDLTGQDVPLDITARAWANLEFTPDPIAPSLQRSAKDAEALDLLERVDLRGIYDLRILNKLLVAEGKPKISSKLKAPKATGT